MSGEECDISGQTQNQGEGGGGVSAAADSQLQVVSRGTRCGAGRTASAPNSETGACLSRVHSPSHTRPDPPRVGQSIGRQSGRRCERLGTAPSISCCYGLKTITQTSRAGRRRLPPPPPHTHTHTANVLVSDTARPAGTASLPCAIRNIIQPRIPAISAPVRQPNHTVQIGEAD